MEDYPQSFSQLSKDNVIPEKNIVAKEVADWSDVWYKSILPENNKLSMIYKTWDKEFKGKLRGKLCPIIGYGGTKKSLLALNIARHNIIEGFGTCLYSTMEMGSYMVINRLIDMSTVPNDGFNPSSELEYHNNVTKKIDAKRFFDESFAPLYKDSFFISENTSLCTEDYDKLITQYKAMGIKIDMLIVDGLAGMGGKGSETELYSRHSKELKELANKHNILVFLICHVSKGGKKTDRDLSSLVRSSEKIIDNCDFYITASLFEEDDGFNQTYGAMRLINKRGSGNTIDVVYKFDKLQLLMDYTDLDFKEFETSID